MGDDIKSFGETAQGLARNPLGIIALFIVLVYGLAALVTTFASALTPSERVPLVYFLIVFPVLVLGVFAWLVSRHSGKLFAPSDFRDEENYIRMQMMAVASLTAATVKNDSAASEYQVKEIVESVRSVEPVRGEAGPGWWRSVLWVDDRPQNNVYERQALEAALGLRFTLAESTDEAFEKLARDKFGLIISDMGRREGPREGYVLLDRLRREGDRTPLIFYAASNAPEHKQETHEHGGQGCTNDPSELLGMVRREMAFRNLHQPANISVNELLG